jgi:cytidylate kinase
VLDGRDIGTVICPDAEVKIFVTASPEVRAKRRFLELQAAAGVMSLDEVLADVLARDARDRDRATAPMKPAEGSLILDTSEMTIGEAVAAATKAIAARR